MTIGSTNGIDRMNGEKRGDREGGREGRGDYLKPNTFMCQSHRDGNKKLVRPTTIEHANFVSHLMFILRT